MKISKIDAARRQLDVALSLFFNDADPISIHTLTAAAHQILMDISGSKGVKSLVKGLALDIIRQDKASLYLSAVNEAENFFKHADRDQSALLEFNPAQTEYLLLDAVEMYIMLTNDIPEDMSIYQAWFRIKNPEFISDKAKNALKDYDINIKYYSGLGKSLFYKKFKEVLQRA